MKKRYFVIPLVLILFLTFCTKKTDIKDSAKISEQDFELLMNQLEGRGCYWVSRGSGGYAVSRMDILVSVNNTTTYDCQNFASRVLGSISKENNLERVVPLLISHLRYKSDKPLKNNDFFPLRWRAMQALGEIKDPRAIEALIEVIHHSRQCLSAKPSPLCLSKREYNENTHSLALKTLTAIGVSRSDIIALLMEGLRSKSSSVRESSVYALGESKTYQAIDSIITLFKKDSDRWVRIRAAQALGKFGPRATKAVPDLIQAARQRNSSDNSIITSHADRNIIGSLAEIRTPEAIDALKEFAKSSDVQRSKEAKKALSLFEESNK
jgi:hypothetical protein